MRTASSHQLVSFPTVLSLDTSSHLTSLCLTRNGEIVVSSSRILDESRSEKLWVELEKLLYDATIAISEIDLFAVCTGPGGFTGLRVGIAAAKGFAAATRKPLIGVTSLEAAAVAAGPGTAIVALVNAYKGEVYSQLFSFDSDHAPVAGNQPLVSTFPVALDRVRHIDGLVLAGDATVQNVEEITKLIQEISGHDSIHSPAGWNILPQACSTAEAVARLALLRYRRGEAGTAESVSACYVRRAEAEIRLARGLLGSKIDRVRRQS